jgi:hypothetical protein
MVVQEIEQAIVEVLISTFPDIQISAFPNDPAELGLPVSTKQIYVGFKSKSLQNPNTSMIGGRVPPQRATLQYELILRLWDLRNQKANYPVMEAIEQVLIGYRPDIGTNCHLLTSALYGTDSGFVDFGAGLWLYSMTFAIDTVFTSQTQPSWGKPISR